MWAGDPQGYFKVCFRGALVTCYDKGSVDQTCHSAEPGVEGEPTETVGLTRPSLKPTQAIAGWPRKQRECTWGPGCMWIRQGGGRINHKQSPQAPLHGLLHATDYTYETQVQG